jgi:transposase-like protein
MPKKFPAEFKADVVAVARRGDLTFPGVAADFGVPIESVRRHIDHNENRPHSTHGDLTPHRVRHGWSISPLDPQRSATRCAAR